VLWQRPKTAGRELDHGRGMQPRRHRNDRRRRSRLPAPVPERDPLPDRPHTLRPTEPRRTPKRHRRAVPAVSSRGYGPAAHRPARHPSPVAWTYVPIQHTHCADGRATCGRPHCSLGGSPNAPPPNVLFCRWSGRLNRNFLVFGARYSRTGKSRQMLREVPSESSSKTGPSRPWWPSATGPR
jgi:hypothetical protein